MQVFDEVNKEWINSRFCIKIVVEHLPNQVIFGYSIKTDRIVRVLICNEGVTRIFQTNLDVFKGELLFSKRRGMYFSPLNFDKDTILTEQCIMGSGEFPYILSRKYEAIENFRIFNDKQIIKDKDSIYPLSKYLNYTFGLEFETSQGYIPEDICYRDGLIPLRDGSITGPEYSTIVLEGNKGIALLHQQLETLKEYTAFNKECSLHVHLGNYPLNPDIIYNLYLICKTIEPELERILPPLTFYSGAYKDNKKDYCNKLEIYNNFDEMYLHLVGRRFFGSFMQAHPNDIERKRKWNVTTRYYYVNFINALCYNVNKTIEFRFLRPTYNFKKIILWLYIFNAILKYADKYYPFDKNINLFTIIRRCYPKEVYKELHIGILKLSFLTSNQVLNGDKIGAETWMEDNLFNDLNI